MPLWFSHVCGLLQLTKYKYMCKCSRSCGSWSLVSLQSLGFENAVIRHKEQSAQTLFIRRKFDGSTASLVPSMLSLSVLLPLGYKLKRNKAVRSGCAQGWPTRSPTEKVWEPLIYSNCRYLINKICTHCLQGLLLLGYGIMEVSSSRDFWELWIPRKWGEGRWRGETSQIWCCFLPLHMAAWCRLWPLHLKSIWFGPLLKGTCFSFLKASPAEWYGLFSIERWANGSLTYPVWSSELLSKDFYLHFWTVLLWWHAWSFWKYK